MTRSIKFLLISIIFCLLELNGIPCTATDEDPRISPESGSPEPFASLDNNTVEISWLSDALRDIAYYLRAHKFNEYDRRYEMEPEKGLREYYKAFAKPPLRSLHWEVRKNCEPSFLQCVDYLRKKVRNSGMKRSDDTTVIMIEQNWSVDNNSEQISQTESECQRMRNSDYLLGNPFEGPIERYQWRVTASYYMCWYTMKSEPSLVNLNETTCDNFAYCLDPTFGPHNGDRRASDDSAPFSCALYSFCPDPCCPMKHLRQAENCWNSADNPCYLGNPAGQRECKLNRSLNTDFRDIILNRWNVTCNCQRSGYQWSSLYGMCIDRDECRTGAHNCDPDTEACLNLDGSFKCACKWGHAWDKDRKRCVPSEALKVIQLTINKLRKDENKVEEDKPKSLVQVVIGLFSNSKAIIHYDRNSMLPFICLFVLLTLCL